MIDEPTKVRSAALLASLGHPTRISMAELLKSEEKSVGEIASYLDIAQSSASQHLAILLRSGVLKVSKRGTTHFYQVRGPRIAKIIELIYEFCEIQGLTGEPMDEAEND